MNKDMIYNNLENSDELKFKELNSLKKYEIDSESIYLAQRRPRRPERSERPDFPEYPDFAEPPFRNRPPMTAPPDISPQLPRGVVIPIPGTTEFNIQYGDVNRNNNRAYQFRNCLNHFTFIWLWNGSTFWFYPIFIFRRTAEGFIWSRNEWVYDSINLNRIFFFKCF